MAVAAANSPAGTPAHQAGAPARPAPWNTRGLDPLFLRLAFLGHPYREELTLTRADLARPPMPHCGICGNR